MTERTDRQVNRDDREKAWNWVWREMEVEAWDLTSFMVFQELREKFKIPDRLMLELGSGSGRISKRLAQEGALVVLLDCSPESLELATTVFAGSTAQRLFIRASCLVLPLRPPRFAIVWAAGLFPHLTDQERQQALREAKYVIRNDGIIVLFNANARCLIHTVGMKFLQLIGKYPYGYEAPITTMRDYCEAEGLELREEYSIIFLGLFIVFFKRLALLPLVGIVGQPLYNSLTKVSLALLQGAFGKKIIAFDKWLSSLLGGYFLVSIIGIAVNMDVEGSEI